MMLYIQRPATLKNLDIRGKRKNLRMRMFQMSSIERTILDSLLSEIYLIRINPISKKGGL